MVVRTTDYGGKFADDQMSMRLDACVTTGGKTFTELCEFQFFNKSSVRVEVHFFNWRFSKTVNLSLTLKKEKSARK